MTTHSEGSIDSKEPLEETTLTMPKCCFSCRNKWMGQSPLFGCFIPLFIVCSSCGNKRCPKASDHRLECTRSNEPGQEGSFY